MQLSKRSILLLLLFSWLSVLASPRAILSAHQGCSGDHCPAQLQSSSLVEKGELKRLSNIAHFSDRASELSIFPSTFKHETIVEVEKRKSPGSSGSNSPNTSSRDPDSTSSSDNGDDTNTGGGLDLDSPNDDDPSATPKDPGAGLDPFATGPSPDPSPATVDPIPATADSSPATADPSPATANPTVATPDPTTAGSTVPSVSAVATGLIASASDPVPTETAASPPAIAPTDTPNEQSGDDNTSGSPKSDVITNEEAAARFCPSTPGGLRLRGLCGSKVAGDDGSDNEPPASVVQDPNPLPPGVAPVVDRTTVNDRYDVIQQDPKPLFRAKEALDARIAGTGQDKPVADFTGKYFPFEGDDKDDILTQEGMESISTMWTTLGRTTPGKSKRIFITPLTEEEEEVVIIHEATFAKDGSFIGALASYRGQDPLKDSPDRIEWSELMFNQLNSISGGGVSALSAVARVSIVRGHATDSTINTALTRTGKTTTNADEIVTFRADAPAGSEEALAFEAISRTDNVNGVLFLLADHFDTIGRKSVTAINVARDSLTQAFSMVIDIA